MHPSSICSCVCVKIYLVIDVLPFFLLFLQFPILSSFARPSALIVYPQSAYCSHAQVIVYAQYIHYRLFMHSLLPLSQVSTKCSRTVCILFSLYQCSLFTLSLYTVPSVSVLILYAQSVYCSLCISAHCLRSVCILLPLYQYSFFTHSLYTVPSVLVLILYAQSVYRYFCISTECLRSLYTDISVSVLNVYAVCILCFSYQY